MSLKRNLLLSAIIAINFVNGQYQIVSTSNPAVDLSGSSIQVSGLATDNEIYSSMLVINNSGQSQNIAFRRVRLLNSTRVDQICDANLCYTADDAQFYTTPFTVTVADGDSTVFKPQLLPDGNESCAIHDYFIVTEFGVKLDSIRIKFSTSNQDCELSLENTTPISNFSIFPNPAKSSINISTPTQSSGQFRIINLLGEEVYNAAFFGSFITIDLTGFQNGIYLVQSLDSSNKPIATQKLIVNK
jgi:hypothetical protein